MDSTEPVKNGHADSGISGHDQFGMTGHIGGIGGHDGVEYARNAIFFLHRKVQLLSGHA